MIAIRIEFEMPEDMIEKQIRNIILDATQKAFKIHEARLQSKEWMTLKEGAKYAGVSEKVFADFRRNGLEVSEPMGIDSLGRRSGNGIKRVSKTAIDSFLKKYED